jgi:hypothetical protein
MVASRGICTTALLKRGSSSAVGWDARLSCCLRSASTGYRVPRANSQRAVLNLAKSRQKLGKSLRQRLREARSRIACRGRGAMARAAMGFGVVRALDGGLRRSGSHPAEVPGPGSRLSCFPCGRRRPSPYRAPTEPPPLRQALPYPGVVCVKFSKLIM